MASSDPSSSYRPLPPNSSESAEESLARHLQPADLRGAAQLATEGTLEGTRLVEAVHAAVLSIFRRGPTRSRTTGLTGWIYRTVRRITRFSGWVATSVLGASEQMMEPAPRSHSRGRHQLLSVLNGVMGDHLAETGSPLARSFSLRTPEGTQLDIDAPSTAASAPLVVFVHGLCLSDRVWTEKTAGRPAIVESITEAVGGTPILARYNTGRSIWTNGRALAEHLERWITATEDPSRIVLVTHSMGGLVARSAVHQARRTAAHWPDLVTETIYIGTPHRGAPLERAGAWVEAQLRRTPLTLPFASLATLRSRGIQNLRHGTIAPNKNARDAPEGSSGRTLFVAGALTSGQPTQDVIGDGLVPVSSALNASDAPPRSTRRVFENVGHLALLRTPAVTEYLCHWLSTAARS
jgi:pimeloyl-ACP methyl ester carboxylesterase